MKNHSESRLSTMLLLLIFPVFSYGLNGKFESKKIGSYRVSITQDFENGLASVVVKKGKDKVFEESEIGNHYYFGNHFDQDSNGLDVYSGRDITGKGMPSLIISNWTGGAHCCHFLHVFELGKKLKKLVTVEAQSSSIRFIDLDHDGFPEIEFWDGAIDYQFASFAGSPGGRVVLKFQRDHYEVANHLMSKPIPTDKKLDAIKRKVSMAFKKADTPDLPYDFLESMMDLSYSGHFSCALKFADEVWPREKSGLEKFKKDFSQALQDSLYWKRIQKPAF